MKYINNQEFNINGFKLKLCLYSSSFFLLLDDHTTSQVDKFFTSCNTTREYILNKFDGGFGQVFPEISRSKLDEFIKFLQGNIEPNYEIY